MNDFTFLTKEQVDDQLDILRKYGKKCAITDYSILLGGVVSSEFTKEGLHTGWWWTQNIVDNRGVRVIDKTGSDILVVFSVCEAGARPVLTNISSFDLNKEEENGILEVEYGRYPQNIVSEDFSRILDNLSGALNQTGKSYTYIDSDSGFQARSHIEYEFNGEKYIRMLGNSNCNGQILSDGRKIQDGASYWVKVEPIKWIIDEKHDIALSKKIIFSGVPFDINDNYVGDFDGTTIKEFMDKCFSKEILGKMTIEEKKQYEAEQIKKGKRLNAYKFNFGKVSEEDIIRGAIKSGVAVFLHGQSSEGKSARVKQIDPNCVIIHLGSSTPESLNGKSVYNSQTGEMIDVKPAWLKKLEERCEKEPDKYHLVFFDELTNALPSIQGMAFNIVLDREVNGIWQLPKNARIVAAGNEMEDSLAAYQLAEPLFNRFAHVYIKTTVESWLQWASENNIHPAIYAYIAYKKEKALRSKYSGKKPNADPRKWEMASKMLYATGRPEMLRALVGEDITKEFVEFCNQKVITLEDVLKGNYTDEDLQMNTSEIYATVTALSQVDEANFNKVREFVQKLGEEPCAIFESLWTYGDVARLEIVAETRLANKKEVEEYSGRIKKKIIN